LRDEGVERIRQHLLRRHEDLRSVGEMAAAGTRIVELDQSRIGRLSRADALQSQAMSLEVKRRSTTSASRRPTQTGVVIRRRPVHLLGVVPRPASH
jgi:DnaK suppressor protein